MANHRGNMHLFEFSESEMENMWKESRHLDTKKCPTLWKFVKEIGEFIDPREGE